MCAFHKLHLGFPSVCQVPAASHPNISPLEGTICFFLPSAVWGPCVYAAVAIRNLLYVAFCSWLSGVSLVGKIQSPGRFLFFFLFFFWLQQLFFFFSPSLNGICSELDALWGGAGISRYFETANPPEPCGYPKSNFRSSFLYEICCFHQLGINRKGEI